MSEIISELSWQFQGGYPDVPVAAAVDIDAFKSDPDPFFVTLPFAKVGVRSRNGKPFDQLAAERLVSEVNSKRPEGILGHVEPLERASRYDLPSLRWLGAMIADDGCVWGKAWVPGYAQEVREFLTDAKRANAKVGLSVYGLTGEHGLHDMTLESIDLGHPERLGIPDAASVPHITSEMYDEESENMGDKEIIAELTSGRDEAQRLVAELQGQLGEKDTLIADLQRDADAARAANKLISETADMWANASLNINASGGDLSTVVQELIEKLTSLKANELRDLFKSQVAELQVEDLRPLVAGMSGFDLDSEMTPELARKLIVSMPANPEAAKNQIAEIMDRPYIKSLAQKLVNELAGPPGVAGGKGRDFKDEIADKAKENAAARGIAV